VGDDLSTYSNMNGTKTATAMYLNYYSGQPVYVPTNQQVTSDDRLKHNEVDISNAIQVINKLKPQKYYKSLKMYSESHNYELDNSGNPITDDDICLEAGLIAQDIQKIPELSYLVEVIPDKSYTTEEEVVDNSGNKQIKSIDVSVPSRLSVRYNDLFVYNIKATQELHQKNIALESFVQSQQTTIEEQQTEIEHLKLVNINMNNQLNTLIQQNQQLQQEITSIKHHLNIQ